MMMQRPASIYDLNLDELDLLLKSWDEPTYRASQIWDGLYRQFWSSIDEFTSLPKSLRRKLSDYFSLHLTGFGAHPNLLSLQPITKQESSDGETIKTLFSIAGGFTIEAVLMRYAKRRTLCISTQAGCAMGCVFCATGQMGFKRQLTSGEIVEQVLFYARQLAIENEQVSNIVAMGMGEPFHNYEATMSAIERLNDPHGYNLGARRFTISTVGLVPIIRKFTSEHRQINLAISLHAADDNLRSELLPINHKYPLDELFVACQEYVQATHRRLSFEWALIQGVNDTPEQAHLLASRLKGFQRGSSMLCHVNVIPLNPTKKYVGQASNHQRALGFQNILEQAGIPCTIRLRRGIDIQAGCGQLAGQNYSTQK
ncbi:MAG: 23S rRNA (adenine(2503)-C(2))-methyltransferase RlmN [Anaerolineales bacterium]